MPLNVYIAAPFFNAAQNDTVTAIEDVLQQSGHTFYSPRIHSGSAKLTPIERQTKAAWGPVLQSNIDALHTCDVLLAVLEYAMPEGRVLKVCRSSSHGEPYYPEGSALEIPDAGVIWECGYRYALNDMAILHVNASTNEALILGFHTTQQPRKLNLMLSHTLHGFVTGYEQLQQVMDGRAHPTDLQSEVI